MLSLVAGEEVCPTMSLMTLGEREKVLPTADFSANSSSAILPV
ncbi:MAG: hypothetical protein U5N86_01955 [Planctomycetota bacterium]|nr:hypothetical protein [Planctomycetota bacterium]